MAINLEKKESSPKYYYAENNIQHGPFKLEELISKINRETLVWRKGIDWTNAYNIDELKGYFSDGETTSKIDMTDKEFDVDFLEIKNWFKNNSSNILKSSFSFKGKIGRVEYIVSLLVYFILVNIVNVIILILPIFSLLYVFLLWFLFAQGAKRCNDIGKPGWFQIIPFYIIWMIFKKSNY